MKKLLKLLCVSLVIVLLVCLIPTYTFAATSAGYIWPVEGGSMSQGYYAVGNSYGHSRHLGLDITGNYGADIKAVNNGTVLCASTASSATDSYCSYCTASGAGFHVVIKHYDGKVSCYSHLSNVFVSTGETVSAGQVIGAMGSTGNSTGTHLHFSMYNDYFNDSYAINPLTVISPFSAVYSYGVTETSATIEGYFGASATSIDLAGIYIGTSPDNMVKITESVYSNGVNPDGSYIAAIFYNTSKWWQELTPGTTYYYKVWMSAYDATYESDVYSFTTLGPAPNDPTPHITITPSVPPTTTATATATATATPTHTPESGSKYTISEATNKAGSTVDVYVSIEENPGIISLRNSISYDTSVLELLSVEDCKLLLGYTTPSSTINSPYTLRWADSLATENNTQNGQIVKLTFKIKENAAVGSYDVSVSHIEARNFNGEKISLKDASTKIHVIEYIVGDVDNDNEITDWDAITLNRYLAGWDVEISQFASDVDGDGFVTDWDAIMLERYLAGWDITFE